MKEILQERIGPGSVFRTAVHQCNKMSKQTFDIAVGQRDFLEMQLELAP